MCPDLYDVKSYDYELPPGRIAQYPISPRDSSQLMVMNRELKSISHRTFRDIDEYLREGDLLVLNSSKVFPARLYATKENGTPIEVLLVNELEPSLWKVMVKPGKRLKEVQTLTFSDRLRGEISLADDDGLRLIRFEHQGDFFEEIEQIGHVPLPPYINRADEKQDKQNYQTIYADELGSIAAPTAGLHFTEELMARLSEKGVQVATLVLHVGMGTFLPVQTERIDEHVMHSEQCTIKPELAELYRKTREKGNRVIAVGTTSLRTLESFYGINGLEAGSKWTNIFLHPGKQIRSIDALITNFHLPKSTLLMLVSAFAGYEFTRLAYAEALNRDYRFFSYGDAMLIY
ncbi:MAG: tRNA preQ1(34) S-adenosylmethionine ribosyltransferase-isomerase QueA [Candidatus Cloacimonadota bacterium]